MKQIERSLFIIFPIILGAGLFQVRSLFFNMGNTFPKCVFHKLTGFFCPACGNTRCVCALLNGDVLHAILYNITPVIILVLLLLLYIEFIVYRGWNVRIYLLPRSFVFWMVFLGIVMLYYFVRNFTPIYGVLAEGL